MKKSLFLCLPALLIATSCVDSLKDYNVDPKRAAEGAVPGVTLVSSAELGLTRLVESTNVNLNPFRLFLQYWTETLYNDESNYNLKTRSIDRYFWERLYIGRGSTDPTVAPGVLRNLSEAKSLITADQFLDPKIKANQIACVEVLSIYAWTVLVDTYGNVPYNQSLDYNNPQPQYDDAATIYTNLFARINAAIAQMDASATGLGKADLVYGGDMSSWIKFANTLKLRMAITTADADAARAKTQSEAAASKVFTSNSDNATLAFQADLPNTNPLWEDLVNSGRHDFVGTSFFVDNLNTLKDPRLGIYFKPVAGTTATYKGGVNGALNTASLFSNPGTALEDPTLPGVLASYSEVEFLLSEAAARGFAVGGTAASHYTNAISASIEQWGGSTTDAAAYLTQPTVAYATAAGDYKQKIGTQAWIALYNQPIQAWAEWRRLDYPKLTAPADALSPIPVRLTYPSVEQNLNNTNYTAAAAAIGGDKVDTKIFWDKF
ncbi:SusD/RagB family nutrient-binding outer membrane lipoprotein [Hymenobacter sp. HMF4947]|uniref:SusD/RagB family nutrient-binding outer membrane lipoprotein n=1 Tax=Hymenobacter ginkgonis TaxID=2682976 RepID=A0A7K1TIH9_9BACT|nr:SusD/RagB family nutrient-binding outer membrane lipoprotein [Hymenobacter ginkgonis]MVN78209.1 SusD/RagB family nutrient-binding outer membrane lipoprotein [Hymenobacter ginkgonis]